MIAAAARLADRPAADFDVGSVKPGSVARVWLTLPDVPSPAGFPAVVVAGARSGPLVVVCAGVHGDEFEGRAGLRVVVDELDPSSVRGTMLVLPTCNPWAAAARTRCTPTEIDGLNLARVFPGDAGGRPTERLAAALIALIRRQFDGRDGALLDLHSGGTFFAYRSMAGFRETPGSARGPSEELARHLGLDCLWAIDPVDGTLTQTIAELGIPAVGTEFRGQGGARPEDVTSCATSVTNALRFLGCLPGPPPARDASRPRRTHVIAAPADGTVAALPVLGGRVSAGDEIAAILDLMEAPLASVRSPLAGELWAVRTYPTVSRDEIVALVAVDPGGPE